MSFIPWLLPSSLNLIFELNISVLFIWTCVTIFDPPIFELRLTYNSVILDIYHTRILNHRKPVFLGRNLVNYAKGKSLKWHIPIFFKDDIGSSETE